MVLVLLFLLAALPTVSHSTEIVFVEAAFVAGYVLQPMSVMVDRSTLNSVPYLGAGIAMTETELC